MLLDIDDISLLSWNLRRKGIPISIRSSETAVKAVQLFEYEGINDYNELKDILSPIYVKNFEQKQLFNEVFEDFIKYLDMKNKKSDEQEADTIETEPEEVKHENIYKPRTNKLNYEDLAIAELKQKNKNAKAETLMETDITRLNFTQEELFEICRRLGQKIANKRSSRDKRERYNKVDIRRSIRKNMKYGGLLIELIKNKPRITKNKHYFLCDVSGSCDWISIWFFCILYAAQRTFNQSRFYNFDNQTIEISNALNEENLVSAYNKIIDIRKHKGMLHGTSDMYTSFKEFKKNSDLNGRSIVIILTDCRDWAGPKEDYVPMSIDVLKDIVNVSKKVVIMNPDKKEKWDKYAKFYQQTGAEVLEVRNLQQLTEFLENI